MALRIPTLRRSSTVNHTIGLRRWTHFISQPAPLDSSIHQSNTSPTLILPEFNPTSYNNNIGFGFPSFSFGCGSMDLMAVPKKKVSPHKRGIRNGPKALKPVPVIIRCKVCGRVKLPHFFCCSGVRENTGEREDSTT